MKSVSLGTAWKEAQEFMQREAGLLIPVALLFIAIPLALMMQAIPPELRHVKVEQGAAPPQVPFYPVFIMFGASLIILGGMLTIYALALKPGISLKEAVTLGFRRMGISLGASLIVGGAMLLPLAIAGAISPTLAATVTLLVVLAVSARMLMLNAIVIDRPVGIIQALKDSWAFSKGNVAKLLLFVIAIIIPIMLAQAVCEMGFGLAGTAIGGPDLGWRLGAVGGSIALALGQMVMAVMTARIYRQVAG